MNWMNIGKRLNEKTQAESEAEARQKEAQGFDLVQTGGFLNVVKYVVFTILAALNVRLFITVVPGWWGYVIGATAVLFECFAVYCWNNQKRSAGRHHKALVVFAMVFTGVSFLHASASFYELVGLGPSLGRPLYVYSHAIAFPLLFTLMITAVCVLYYTHWSAAVAKEQAKAQTQIATDRATLLARTAALANQAEQARAELEHHKARLNIERDQLGLLESVIALEQRKQAMLDGITDPAVRKRILDLLAIDEDGNGVPDAFEKPELRAELDGVRQGYLNGKADLPN